MRGRKALGLGGLAQGNATYLAKLQAQPPNPCGEEKEHIEPMKSLGAWIPKPPAIIAGNQVGDHIAPLASIS